MTILRMAFGLLLLTATANLAIAQDGGAIKPGDFAIQLASFKSPQAAEQSWARLLEAHPKILGDMVLTVQSADLGDRGLFYRVQTGPFPTQATAEDLCWQLRAEKVSCLVIRR